MPSYDPGGHNDDLDNSPARARDLYWRRFNRRKIPPAVMLGGFVLFLVATAGVYFAVGWSASRGGATPGGSSASVSLPSGTQVADSDTKLMKGGAIFVEWSGSWYRAEVVKLRDDGTVRIHYIGWDDKWDEDVQRDRIRVGP